MEQRANRRGCVRKGRLGCLGATAAGVVVAALIWFLAPGIVDAIVDWALYVEPPAVQVSPDGKSAVKSALAALYSSVQGESAAGRVVLTEGAINGLLGGSSEERVLSNARVDLGSDAATVHAAIDLKRAAESKEYKELLANVPSFLRDRRVSVRVEFQRLTTAGDRLNFEEMEVKVGRIWVPVSGDWALPILQRMAESRLGTGLPEKGLPLPPGATAAIAGDALTIEMPASRH